MPSASACDHVPSDLPTPAADRCEECGSGFNLRMCTSCGHVGCCESQAGHARAHSHRTGHPVIRSMPVSGGFTWCYLENRYV
ncbi:MAG: UBP-type zinc finger domain-containing protein [Chloroflexota bacterium]